MAPVMREEKRLLVCAECGRSANEQALGWKAYRTDDEPPQVDTFCPACAAREFELGP
jgi:hypothetical protein